MYTATEGISRSLKRSFPGDHEQNMFYDGGEENYGHLSKRYKISNGFNEGGLGNMMSPFKNSFGGSSFQGHSGSAVSELEAKLAERDAEIESLRGKVPAEYMCIL